MVWPAADAAARPPSVIASDGQDALAEWRRVRQQVLWADLPADPPHRGRVDGVAALIESHRADEPGRRDGLRQALRMAARAADLGAELTPSLLRRWQLAVLGHPVPAFRSGVAYAKQGRERYGLDAGTASAYAACLREAVGGTLPASARAARAYLDVAFFHPFADGNARAALLSLYFVLRRDGIMLEQAEPLLIPRRADDAEGAFGLARLIHLLAQASGRTGGRPGHR